MTRVQILGVEVDAVTETQAVDWVAAALQQGRLARIVTVNPEFVMRARRDREFAAVLASADLALPDGAGLLWAARRLRQPLPGRVAGVDFVRALARRGVREGWRFFLLGAQPGVGAAAAAALQRDFPGLQVTGCLTGSPDAAEDQETTTLIRAAGADIVLVAYGAPAQDLWVARNLARSGARIGMGVGGAFDFISGRARRAPPWMRDHGLEWLHRLAREPWRWRRMVALPRFVVHVWRAS